MGIGVVFASAAGLLWGLAFLGPLLLPDYPAPLVVAGRYLAFGLVALPLAWWDRAELKALSPFDWIEALKLSAVGNLLYYFFLASALQRAGGPVPTLIIGTLPVVLAVVANVNHGPGEGRLPWSQLAPCLGMVLAGIACVNHVETGALDSRPEADHARYLGGVLLAVCAVVCWAWYALRNARLLLRQPGRSPRAWATAQGITTLPMALLAYGAFWWWSTATGGYAELPLGPRPGVFLGVVLALGLLASWLATHCWNEASQRLPAVLAGPLIVLETLAALVYGHLLRGGPLPAMTLAGAVLLVAGVVAALRIRPRPATAAGGL